MRTISDFLYRQSFGPGSVIFEQGEAGDRAYIIESGHVEITSHRGDSELILACLGDALEAVAGPLI